ncbi:MAG: hypothetical protein ACKOWJ_03965 [Micrococcales bacterium]
MTLTTLLFIFGTVSDAINTPKHFAQVLGADVALVAIFLLTNILVIFIARQLLFQKRWARSAAVFWQLIQIAIAWNSFTGDTLGYFIGGWLSGTAGAGLVLLFSKDVIDGTTEKVDRE